MKAQWGWAILSVCLICFFLPLSAAAFLDAVEGEYGGHFKTYGQANWYADETPLRLDASNPFYDGSSDLRLKAEWFSGPSLSFKVHYEAALIGGQTRSQEQALPDTVADLSAFFYPDAVDDDQLGLFDLTHTIAEENDYVMVHRLDRLSLAYQTSGGMLLRLGRQAVTWGNGMLFNPLDLFNPFSPTTIDKDYKTGADMVYGQWPTEEWGEWQFLYVPRRDPADDNHVRWEQSSLAAKVHFRTDALEIDLMGARHYEDSVAGVGLSGYLKNAAWRVDMTWTMLEDSTRGDYFSLVANMDYSWVWWNHNLYGFLEYYHHGLGLSDSQEALLDNELTQRLARGEIFVLERNYLAGSVQIELHPLVNVYLILIQNLHDRSGAAQPRLIWNVMQNFNLTLGGNWYYGDRSSEFGGIIWPDTSVMLKPANAVYCWAAFYF